MVQVGLLGMLSSWAYFLCSSESPYKQRKPENLKQERVWCTATGLKMAGWQEGWVVSSWERPLMGSQQEHMRRGSPSAGLEFYYWPEWPGKPISRQSCIIPDEYSAPGYTLIPARDTLNRGTSSHCVRIMTYKPEGAGKHISPELPDEHSE